MRDNTDSFIAWFRGMRGAYGRLVDEVKFSVEHALTARPIEVSQIIGRTKSEDSLRQRLARKQYTDPREEIEDLAGVRVICLYQPDVDAVSQLVDAGFRILKSEDKRDTLGSDRMGYQGIHKIVALDDRFAGPRYEGLANLKCEVQIRTIVQDAWAAISHSLYYKNEAATPLPIQRTINKLSSLLEIAQDVFDSVRERSAEYRYEIRQTESEPLVFLAQPINHDSIVEYTLWRFPNLPVSERVTQLLLADLDLEEFKTLADIDAAVNAAEKAVQAYAKENPSVFKFGTDWITKSLGFANSAFRGKHRFAKQTRVAFEKHQALVTE